MSDEPPVTTETSTTSPSTKPISAPKLRSCVVCRARKVRCDKLSPCSNCRRANIPCVVPSSDRPPRWARRLERLADNAASNARAQVDPAASQLLERLRTLEDLVKELRSQLEQANAAVARSAASSSGVNSPESSTHGRDDTVDGEVQEPFGRLVLQDRTRSRYVSSGFWSRVEDEVCRSSRVV